MIKDSEKRTFDVVIVWKLNCFARNRYDSANYKTILKRNNVRVLSSYKMYEEGMTVSEIADDFNVKGLRYIRGTKFNINSVSKILTTKFKYRKTRKHLPDIKQIQIIFLPQMG